MKKQTIKVGEYTAAYISTGQGSPLIFLHGFFGNSSTLYPITNELKESHHCFSLDLLGFGESSKPDIDYLIDVQVDFLEKFIQAMELSEFSLIGYSYGAWVAAAYTISKQSFSPTNETEKKIVSSPSKARLNQLVLIAPAGIRDDKFVGRYNHLQPLLWDSPLIDFSLNIISPIMKLLGRDKEIKLILEVRQALMDQPVAKNIISRRSKPEDAVDTVEKNLTEITVPSLIIAGEEDQHIPLWHSQTYAENIPNASIKIIPKANHNLVDQHGKKISQLIQELIEKQ